MDGSKFYGRRYGRKIEKSDVKIFAVPEKERLRGILLSIFVTLIVLLVSILKYRTGEINYYNSDATWHVLYTIEAYSETPVSEHLFLPLVSPGAEEDKYIPWGACVEGRNGNYYYTSFSALGYFLPWLFMKLFLPTVSESGLYLFNSLLFAVSAVLWTWFIYMLYVDEKESRKNAYFLAVIAALTYIFSPELLHGMGIVYWHQSVMQVTLLLQVMAWYRVMKSDSRKAEAVFYLFAIFNAYLEWTGYVTNAGFALAEIVRHWKTDRKRGFAKAYAVGAFSLFSFGMFVLHYLLRVKVDVFFAALKERFFARNLTVAVSMADVFGGYIKSFLYLWVLILILVIWNFIRNGQIAMQKGLLTLVLAFPVLENMIMKEHAISYTYDRMKLVFLLSFLICELGNALLCVTTKRQNTIICLLAATILICGLNLRTYMNDTARIWETDYRVNNQVLADYISENYQDSVMAVEPGGYVRGYINFLFGRGIYEGLSEDQCIRFALEKGKRYAVMIVEDMQTQPYNWNLCPIMKINVYDIDTEIMDSFSVLNGEILSVNGGAI